MTMARPVQTCAVLSMGSRAAPRLVGGFDQSEPLLLALGLKLLDLLKGLRRLRVLIAPRLLGLLLLLIQLDAETDRRLELLDRLVGGLLLLQLERRSDALCVLEHVKVGLQRRLPLGLAVSRGNLLGVLEQHVHGFLRDANGGA